MVIDYGIYVVIFSIGAVFLTLGMMAADRIARGGSGGSVLAGWFPFIVLRYAVGHFAFLPPLGDIYSIFFWSGFVPSIWMWLYVIALFVTRLLLRSEKLVNWLRWALDIEKAPFRSIGAVAATLAFIASVAIILVSVEVSRISATS
jgi:hypothetical protein